MEKLFVTNFGEMNFCFKEFNVLVLYSSLEIGVSKRLFLKKDVFVIFFMENTKKIFLFSSILSTITV